MPDHEKPSEWEDEGATNVTSLPTDVGASGGRTRPAFVVIEGPNVGDVIPLDFGDRGEAGAADMVLGRSSGADLRFEDDSMSRRHASLRAEHGRLWIEDLKSAAGTWVNGARIGKHALKDGEKVRMGVKTVLRFQLMDPLDEGFQRRMYDLALRDPLTGAFNKRYLFDRLTRELAFARRHKTEVALLLFDVDHFKRVNDTYGHQAGDAALAHLSALAQATVRAEDVFARYGGEEFAVLSRGISVDRAAVLADRLRVRVEESPVHFEDKTIPLTVSIGVAGYPALAAEAGGALVSAADEALYAAKDEGRNRVKTFRP